MEQVKHHIWSDFLEYGQVEWTKVSYKQALSPTTQPRVDALLGGLVS